MIVEAKLLGLEDKRQRITEVVSHGLIAGVGNPVPGQLCLEAAICLALGLPHGDQPPCVAGEDRRFAIGLNDAPWSSPAARAEGMLPLGLAQLGTAGTDRSEWVRRVVEGTIRRVLPIALRAAAVGHPVLGHRLALAAAADRCAAEGSREAARAAEAAAGAAGAAAAGVQPRTPSWMAGSAARRSP